MCVEEVGVRGACWERRRPREGKGSLYPSSSQALRAPMTPSSLSLNKGGGRRRTAGEEDRHGRFAGGFLKLR